MKINNIFTIKGQLPVKDPYIMAAYHYDLYPQGNGQMGPAADISDRVQGNDFNPDAKWRMYHGDKIPGFPYHPHRGFEIVTYVAEGFADHCDSRGSKGRYGDGDVQLMSAGKGVLHSEMFPLIYDDKENPLRLFQIWLNLPAKSKLTEPDYKMIWSEQLPEGSYNSENGGEVKIKVLLGNYNGISAVAPLKNSWAANPANHVGIAAVELAPGTSFTLPKVSHTLTRFVFFYDGAGTIQIDGMAFEQNKMLDLNGGEEVVIQNGDQVAKILVLEGEPIGEPVAAYGPFVMNTYEELEESFAEYRQTQFGGWPWGPNEIDMVNPKDAGRFASYNFDKEIDRP